MASFLGAAAAMLFPADAATIFQKHTIDTAGTSIEREFMELIEVNHIPSLTARTSFVNSEFEETNESPKVTDTTVIDNTLVNSYGRPTAAILPTQRRNGNQVNETSQRITTYPPKHNPEISAFYSQQENVQSVETADVHVVPTFG